MKINFEIDPTNMNDVAGALDVLFKLAGTDIEKENKATPKPPVEAPTPAAKKTGGKKADPKPAPELASEPKPDMGPDPIHDDSDEPFDAPEVDTFAEPGQDAGAAISAFSNADLQAVVLDFLKSYSDKAEQIKHRDALRKLVRDDFGVAAAAELTPEQLPAAFEAIIRYIKIVKG